MRIRLMILAAALLSAALLMGCAAGTTAAAPSTTAAPATPRGSAKGSTPSVGLHRQDRRRGDPGRVRHDRQVIWTNTLLDEPTPGA